MVMKKNLINAISMFAFVGGTGVGFAETEYVAADNSPISNLCVSAAVDDKIRFNLNRNKSRLTDRYIRTNIACNGKPLRSLREKQATLVIITFWKSIRRFRLIFTILQICGSRLKIK